MKKILMVLVAAGLSVSLQAQNGAPAQFNEATIAQLQAKMRAGTLTSVELTKFYLARIAALDQSGTDGGVNAIIELNPDALAIAQQMDELRRQGTVLGPLHGIPVLLKDNIDTGDRMQTSAGSFALFGPAGAKGLHRGCKSAAQAAQLFSARRISRSGQTSAPSNRPAAGQAAAVKPTIPMRSIAIRAAPVPARARPLQQISPPSRLAAKRTAASFVPATRMAWSRSSRPWVSLAALVWCQFLIRRTRSAHMRAQWPTLPSRLA